MPVESTGVFDAGIRASDDQVRRLAEEILSESRYATFRSLPSGFERLRDQIDEWLAGLRDFAPDWLMASWQWLRDLFRSAWDFVETNNELVLGPAEWIVGALLVAFLIVVAVSVGRSVRATQVEAESTIAQALRARRALLSEADELARAEHFLEAAQRTQLAALQLLLERRWLELARSDPNRTLRLRLERTPLPDSLRARFVGLLDRLESQWFRDRGEDRELYVAWRTLHSEIERLDLRSAAPQLVATGAQ